MMGDFHTERYDCHSFQQTIKDLIEGFLIAI